MFTQRIDLFKIFGFPIRLDLSWFLIVALLTWSLATGFAQQYEDLARPVVWAMGFLGALGLFVSVLLHELSHALVARRFDLRIRGITLFLFGGVAEMEDEPPSPRAEFLVAVAGPIASLLIGVACAGIWALGKAGEWPVSIVAVIGYLAMINVVLVVFNLIPAFPLDGGRMLRAALWHYQDDLRRATRISSGIGSSFGIFLIVLGVILVFNDALVQGMWMALIGLFLRGASQMSYQQLLLRRLFEGEPVKRFMHGEPISVPRAASVAELVEDYVYRHHFKMFPVVQGEELVGCVTTRDVKELPPDEWQRQSVGAISQPCDETNTVGPDDDTMAALSKMQKGGLSRLLVVEESRLVGILTLKDLLGFLSAKVELEGSKET